MYLHDRDADGNGVLDEDGPGRTTTTLVSAGVSGGGADHDAVLPALAPRGRRVSFSSPAANLEPGDAGPMPWAVWVRDTCAGAPAACVPSTTRVSVATDGSFPLGVPGSPYRSSLSGDGRLVAFETAAALAPADVESGTDVYVRDTCAGAPAGCVPSTRWASPGLGGASVTSLKQAPSMSQDGAFVAFESDADDLVPVDANGVLDAFLVRLPELALPAPVLTVDPPSATVIAGGTLPLVATVQGGSAAGVVWTVAGPGSVAPGSGPSTTYTAPYRGSGATPVGATVVATLGATSVNVPLLVAGGTCAQCADEVVALVTGGDHQTGATGMPLAEVVEISVAVRDPAGGLPRPLAGATVELTTPDGGSASPASAVTDVRGRVATTWTLGPAAGGQALQVVVRDGGGTDVASTSATASAIAVPSCGAPTVAFFDGDFAPGDWTDGLAAGTSAASAMALAEQRNPGGNPDRFRLETHSYVGAGILLHQNLKTAAVYNPALSGPISSLDVSFDMQNPGSGNVALFLVLEQNGTLYRNKVAAIAAGSAWRAFSALGLLPADFVLVNGSSPSPPDFRGNAPITFGYLVTTSSTSATASVSHQAGLDNFRVTVHCR